MTHSILEPNALAIRTKLGTVFHTGDWKIDPEPLLGEVTDEAVLRRIGDEGALAMVCDSTNVFVEGEAGSEATVRANLEKLVKTRKCRVAVTCFASNLARRRERRRGGRRGRPASGAVGPGAAAHGRGGAGMRLPARLPAVRPEQQAGYLPREKVLFICTGSQGEPRASMAKLANGEHPRPGAGGGRHRDLLLARHPGQRAVGRPAAQRAGGARRRGDHRPRGHIHVSGHPARDELAAMYQWVRPKIALPVHGEVATWSSTRRSRAACQVPETIVAPNGTLVRLAPGPAEIIDHVQAGRLARDGDGVVPLEARRCASAASCCGTARRPPPW